MQNAFKTYLKGEIMTDYKEMYFKLLNATEDAMRILIKAQQECEELYLSSEDEEDER